jgi:hypothetical protein
VYDIDLELEESFIASDSMLAPATTDEPPQVLELDATLDATLNEPTIMVRKKRDKDRMAVADSSLAPTCTMMEERHANDVVETNSLPKDSATSLPELSFIPAPSTLCCAASPRH